MILDRNLILAQTKLPTKEIDVPEWDGKVLIRVMSTGERQEWEKYVSEHKEQNFRERTAVASICDEAGNLLFTVDDMPLLSKLHAKAIDRIYAEAVIMNRVGRDDIAELKKNSSTTPNGDSSFVSPDTSIAQ